MNAPRHADNAHRDGRSETPNERSDRNWNDILQELRVSLTGTQLIGGFLLAVAFQPRFAELDGYQLTLYLVLVALAGLATVVGLAPVTLHRALFRRQAKERVVRTGNLLLIANLIVVALLVVGVTSLVFDIALSRTAGFVALGVGTVVLIGIWIVVPRLHLADLDGGDGDDARGGGGRGGENANAERGADDDGPDAPSEREGVGTPS
ncbi:DUF6328 family protein [Agromyces bauzanensis]|uniref:Sodium:proton antiporter n=1 Tax=Agromyces bauzanensis TaxID=1308924 RepID=A0A917PJS5_9MICO|nr:DUF6328 family protein [Agromyces bauzanensis]GGJ81394.1 hypothetical protein GCM10011372_19760 [Agromyces bauzanensis]